LSWHAATPRVRPVGTDRGRKRDQRVPPDRSRRSAVELHCRAPRRAGRRRRAASRKAGRSAAWPKDKSGVKAGGDRTPSGILKIRSLLVGASVAIVF
jgi:hypothetical protein